LLILIIENVYAPAQMRRRGDEVREVLQSGGSNFAPVTTGRR
jgi:hypothetical protein